MQFPPADISSLFAQLGLAHSDEAIAYFIDAHRPLPESVPLTAAPFWTRPQSELLRQAVLEDADWAHLVEELDARLRH